MTQDKTNSALLATALLAWYDKSGRNLPWRVKGGRHPHPYHVWLSEIMLQQTTVATVKSYFEKFIAKWPHLEDFAAASMDDVLHAWQGLGYYARARNMVKCAQVVVSDHQGKFPETAVELETLPGIGPYTAAAVASIAFEDHVTPVDGNVIRVLSRIFAVQTPIPQSVKEITTLAKTLTPQTRTGDFAQALMDLGATICTPRKPSCLICPWQSFCQGFQQRIAQDLPRKLPKSVKPTRYAVAFIISNDQDETLFGRRPETGLLGGMMEIPTTAWRSEPWHDLHEAYACAPFDCQWQADTRKAFHSFTHFNFDITVVRGRFESSLTIDDLPSSLKWVKLEDFTKLALPTVMKKILKS
ncbi:MAG: A/G-specific adenine glycosylase [Janthinobacterium lividum]